ncbi:integral membrane protein [Aulographum hederae CBS 113979]|uniref:Integral membrane protein n=1 Tax=Aulographum hederae CBS 113979 TaxID=1176131 RepID=A0A6G1H1X2_9PEZI|nr:integral membrane protein [Aulographum hederae CBS 113979]
MTRGDTFHPDRRPLQQENALQIRNEQVNGPFKTLNPTRAVFNHEKSSDENKNSIASQNQSAHQNTQEHHSPGSLEFHWASRNNRKGRHQLKIRGPQSALPGSGVPRPTTHWREICKGIGRIVTRYPVWDISWLVAYLFTWGSIIWVINGFFVFLPILRQATEFQNEVLVGGGITAFIGATIFEVGSILLILESYNENRTGCFGWAVEHALDEHGHEVGSVPKILPNNCTHHHLNRKNLVGKGVEDHEKHNGKESSSSPNNNRKSWVWYPSWEDLRTHYMYEIGFLASLSQLIGATIFWISGFTALPGILDHLSLGLEDGIYWTPQVIGGTGFIVSGTLFMAETQTAWYKPALGTLGWHIGFWNTIGGIGFTLTPAFGYDPSSWSQFQASCSTFWGSFAFLIGSVIQLYESLEKNPVAVSA